MFIIFTHKSRKIKPKKILKSTLVFLLVTSWLLTGYPGFWLSPVEAATTTVFITSTSQTSWTVPNDWTNTNTIELIGGGGGGATGSNSGAGGGGGGAYAKITNLSLTPGSSVTIKVGAGGVRDSAVEAGDTWFNGSTCAGASVCADAGMGTSNATAGAGGTTTDSVGTTLYAGGNGGTGYTSGDTSGGGGGAGGPGGAGKNGGNGLSATSAGAGGGGGSGGGSSTVGSAGAATKGGAGGNGYGGTGGGTAGSSSSGGAGTAPGAGGGGGSSGFNGGNGAAGQQWDSTHGSGGGGGGGANNSGAGGTGALYGGGGGGTDTGTTGATGGQGIIVITYTIDATAPTPDPMTFSSNPSNSSESQIDMTASQATDENVGQSALSYLFTLDTSGCTSANIGTGGDSSSWQLDTLTYSDTGLESNKCYGYKVQAKDTAGNTTSASSITTLYTSAAVPGTPTLGTPTSSTLALTNSENGNPSSNPTTYFAVQVTTTSPTDSTWLNKWVNASGNPSASEVWMTDAQLDALVLQGLQPSTLYGVKVKARNNDGDETSLSAEGQGTTSSLATSTFTQNKYRWYYDNDAVNPTTAWGALAIAENTAIPIIPAGYDPPDTTQELRLRTNIVVNTSALSAGTNYFKLEYKAGTDGSCTTGSWTDVGTGVWTYATSTVTDGSNITSMLSDTTSGKGEQYVKSKPSALNNVGANIGEIIEYDFHIIGGTAVPDTTYSFRVVGTDSGGSSETILDAYTNCPTLTTEPGTADLMRHGQVFNNGLKKGFFWVN